MREYSEEERLKAEELAEKLRQKIEEYFPKECVKGEIEEVKTLRKELETMGFYVAWNGFLDPATLEFKVTVTFLVPKQIH